MAKALARSQELSEKVAAARARLDAHVRHIVHWHFDPATGCPFWIELAATELGFDPRREIGGYADLVRFPCFDPDWLRGGSVRRWVPRALAEGPIHVFQTDQPGRAPLSRIDIDDFRIDYEIFSETLSEAAFPRGKDWLLLGPTGPHRLRLAIEHLAQHRGGIAFCVDMDPRWIDALVRQGRPREARAYREHVIEQGIALLRAHKDIECMFTTPRLLEAICERISLADVGIKGVFCSGESLTPEFHRLAREDLLDGQIAFVPTYGHTLMGLACHRPFDEAEGYSIMYHPPSPRGMIDIVDPDDPSRVVEYGQRGRVSLTTLTREFFMPRLLTEDEARRCRPCEAFPWDGAGDVRWARGI